ncbi:hypothetical protein BKA70DRAFT_1372268 [Coprinopsis sp. MPI-PUGE-AT-0042]|nr:hypothetical protein BKA70DRAFT_1372268 [Coprinopsis sp. MPI-PUGE-AT-0042]
MSQSLISRFNGGPFDPVEGCVTSPEQAATGADPAPRPLVFKKVQMPWENLGQQRGTAAGKLPPSTNPQPLQHKQIRIKHHPKRKRSPELVSLPEYTSRRHRARLLPANEASLRDRPLYYPFATRYDYDFAKLVFGAKMREGEVTNLLNLINAVKNEEENITCRTYQDVHDAWSQAGHLVTPFEAHNIVIPFHNQDISHTFWEHSLWNWFEWDPERVLVEKGESWEHFVNEPWTGDDWFKLQDSLPEGASAVCLIIYADKTELSTFGTEKGYPVYAKIANLPSHIRNGKGIGGGHIVGWLPIVDYRRIVWHACFKVLLNSLRRYWVMGAKVKCGDKVTRHIFPRILMLSADYEEQVIMAGIRGINTSHPCPVCLVTKDDLNKYCDVWEPQDPREAQDLYEVIEGTDKQDIINEIVEELKKMGFRAIEVFTGLIHVAMIAQSFTPLQNGFWSLPDFDLHLALCFDRLHNYPGGLAKSHILPLIFAYFDNKRKTTRELKDKLNKRAAAFPQWWGLTNFQELMKNKAFQDSNKWEDIARIFLFILHDVFPQDKTFQQLLRCLRSFLNLNAYSSFETHTTSTLEAIKEELKRFVAETNAFWGLQVDPKKSWKAPKMHMQMHMVRDILGKGATKHYTTKIFETMHQPLKLFYQWMTNFHNVAMQILDADHRQYIIEYIDSQITLAKEILAELEADGVEEALSDFEFDYEAELDSYAGICEGFSLVESLKAFIETNRDEFEFDFTSELLIRSFRSIEVFYTSEETWESESHVLRCSPLFYTRPHYDCVMVQTQPIMFARLLALFSLQAGKDSPAVPVALVLPYTRTITRAEHLKDKRLGFYRVRPDQSPKPEIVFARSIIRGTVLVPTDGPLGDHFVFDVLDSDMFLRAQTLLDQCTL